MQEKNGESRAVCYASRSLSQVERRYSQTEKEALALVWACERFNLYLYGLQTFDLVTDHEALKVIVSKKRYNNVNKRITIFIFADYLSSYYESQARPSLCNNAFKISSYYLIKVCVFCFVLFLCFFFFLKKGFFCLYEKYVFSPVPFLCMIFAEMTFCSSINLEQPVMVLVLFFLTYQLSCGMRYLILSVPTNLLVLKENPGMHFVQRLFFLMNISLNIMYLVGICICYVF